jgi:ABC-2 type transport system ATP-binding protein
MAGLSSSEACARADLLLTRFGLDDRDRRVFGYSSGMRVRLGLARALIAQPKLLILDEPSRSLDPVASAELQLHLRELAEDGTAVVLSSHRLDEVEAICDRVLVLIDGRQRAWSTTAELAQGTNSAADSLREMLGTGTVT